MRDQLDELVKFSENPSRPRLFPRYKDLSNQFSAEVPIQHGGMCHVYAAADLFEAACKRYLGKSVCISRPYLIYRHLRAQFKARGSYDLDVKKLAAHHFFMPECDGGICDNSLNRAFNGSVCTAQEFKAEEELLDYLSKAADQAKAERDASAKHAGDLAYANGSYLSRTSEKNKAIEKVKSECNGRFPGRVCENLERIVKAGLGDLTTDPGGNNGVCARTSDKDLQACLALDLHGERIPFTRTDALRFLSEGIPFLCAGNYSFKDKYGTVGHVGVVTGYYISRPGTTIDDSTIYWKERHATPGDRGTRWFSGDCEEMIVLYRRN